MADRPNLSRRQLLILAGLGGLGLRTLAWAPRLQRPPDRAPSHGHLKRFVLHVRTSRADERKIIERRNRVRHRISRQAERVELRLARTPNAGSYAKRTALRRYMHGHTKIGGSDIDMPFVLTARSGDRLELEALLELFEGFVRGSYPRSKIVRTKSSIKLEFSSFKYSFDIVPMVAVSGDSRREYLFRADGTKVPTSVSAHVRFCRRRTAASAKSPGIVRFNDMVRLFKWWSQMQALGDELLAEVPSIVLELLCAKAFDERGVESSYTSTLRAWFELIAGIVAERREVRFDEQRGAGESWAVIDPVSATNNVVPSRWTDAHIDRLAGWLRAAAITMKRVEACDRNDDGKGALRELEGLFGPVVGRLDLLDLDPSKVPLAQSC